MGIGCLALFARALPSPRSIDDSFITFRYSRNIAAGNGFVYNLGQPSLGTTTPLYTLLMAAISALTGRQDYPWYALTVNAFADAGTAILLYLLARRLSGRDLASVIPGVLWALSPLSTTFAIGGMETSVNILWMVAATWVYAGGAKIARANAWIGVFAALGVLTRVDAVLWIAPLMFSQLFTNWRERAGQPPWKRLPWESWLTAGLVVLPWFIFSLASFGSLLPSSISSKSVAYIISPGSALITFIQTYATPFFEDSVLGGSVVPLTSLVYLILGLFGLLYSARRVPRLLPFLLYPWLYLVVFSAANPLVFRWYLAPPLPALMLAIFCGVWSLLAGKALEIPRWRAGLIALPALFWVITSLSAWQLHPDHGPDRPAPAMAWHKIELFYQTIGTALRDEYGVTAQTRVASADIGAVGYFSGATILDTVGLVTPALSKYYPFSLDLLVEGQVYAIPPQMILDEQPDYLVTMEAFVRLGLEQNAQFKTAYTLVRQIPTDFYGTGMYLYQRQGS